MSPCLPVTLSSAALKIADFGIGSIVAGHALDVAVSAPTRGRFFPTAMRGACTPLYASPQQERGEDADPRDDVYALGVIWYQMLTGTLFERPGADWREELDDLHIPGRVLDVMGRCLAIRAERRLANAGVLAGELAELIEQPARPRMVSKPAVVLMSEPDDEELNADSDDPFDLAAQMQRLPSAGRSGWLPARPSWSSNSTTMPGRSSCSKDCRRDSAPAA